MCPQSNSSMFKGFPIINPPFWGFWGGVPLMYTPVESPKVVSRQLCQVSMINKGLSFDTSWIPSSGHGSVGLTRAGALFASRCCLFRCLDVLGSASCFCWYDPPVDWLYPDSCVKQIPSHTAVKVFLNSLQSFQPFPELEPTIEPMSKSWKPFLDIFLGESLVSHFCAAVFWASIRFQVAKSIAPKAKRIKVPCLERAIGGSRSQCWGSRRSSIDPILKYILK